MFMYDSVSFHNFRLSWFCFQIDCIVFHWYSWRHSKCPTKEKMWINVIEKSANAHWHKIAWYIPHKPPILLTQANHFCNMFLLLKWFNANDSLKICYHWLLTTNLIWMNSEKMHFRCFEGVKLELVTKVSFSRQLPLGRCLLTRLQAIPVHKKLVKNNFPSVHSQWLRAFFVWFV